MPTTLLTKPMYWIAVPVVIASLFGADYWAKHPAVFNHSLFTHAQATAPASAQQLSAPSAYITLPNFANIAASQP